MNKKTIIKSIIALVMGTSVFSLASISKNDIKSTNAYYDNHDAATYYSGISKSLSGTDLLNSLRSLNSSKRRETIDYDSMGTSPNGYFKYTDYDPSTVLYDENNQPYGTKIISFYSGKSTTSWNREHVWPASRNGTRVENDIHMPRPTISSENGSRGNSFYVEGKCSTSGGWDPAMESFGVESYRGDSARIIFYCCVANNTLSLVDTENGSGATMGKLSDLLKWNLEYPVLQREMNRNEGAEYLQGNRNPFIDHPEYACKIWGNTNSTTKDVCSRYGSQTAPKSIVVTPATSTLIVGEELVLDADTGEGSMLVTWSSSDNTVASVSPTGVVTALKPGTVTIKATSDVDPNVYGTASISIKELKNIALEGNPVKKVYEEGEMFNPDGLTVKATYSDNTTGTISNEKCEWFDGTNTASKYLLKGTTSVVCSYNNLTARYNGISVNAAVEKVYTIKFKSAEADGSSELSASAILETIESGNEYVSSFTGVSKVFPGQQGLKLGASKNSGSLTINVSNELKKSIKAIKIKTSQYNSDTGTVNVKTNFDGTAQSVVPESEIKETTLNFIGELTSISIYTSSKRAYLQEVSVVVGTSALPSTISSSKDYALYFLNKTKDGCENNNVSLETWDEVKEVYNSCSPTLQENIKQDSGIEIEEARERYISIVSKYKYEDFMNIARSSSRFFGVTNSNSSMASLVLISFISISGFSVLFVLKKKKNR